MAISGRKVTGFTLIELSIVLVIIGLIVGGVLVGRDLISAATVRAQITQVEEFQTAANTFKVKYGFLPGDIKDPEATNFGFLPRGSKPGQGDGDGSLVGNEGNCPSCACGGPATNGINSNLICPAYGEQGMFWVDLSTAHLIKGGFSTATPTATAAAILSGSAIDSYLPQAKAGGYVFVWSGGDQYANKSYTYWNGLNYFEIAGISRLNSTFGTPNLTSNLTAEQAYKIDSKIDDGLPQYGRVTADSGWWGWAGDYDSSDGLAVKSGSGKATIASSTTCYDNAGVIDATERYSISTNNGRGMNCYLSLSFQ